MSERRVEVADRAGLLVERIAAGCRDDELRADLLALAVALRGEPWPDPGRLDRLAEALHLSPFEEDLVLLVARFD